MADILVRDTRTGEVFPIPEESAPELIRRGLVVPSGGEGGSSGVGGAVHRFLESIASETTLGASDVARREGGVSGSMAVGGILPAAAPMALADLLSGQWEGSEIDAAQQARAAEHPVEDVAGRVVGGLGQAFGSAGAGATRVGSTLARLSPVGLAETGGDLAARAIRSTISGRAGRVAGALGRYGTEGAIAGAEGMIIDAAANDTPLTGEALVAGAGFGGLLGLGMGSLGVGASSAIRRMRAQRVANGAFGPGPIDRFLGRTQEIMGGVDRGIIDEMQNPARRALATTPEHELIDIASQRATGLQDIADARLRIQNNIDLGASGYAAHLANVDPHLAQTAALTFLNNGIRSLRAGIRGAGPINTRGLSGLLRRLTKTARRLLPTKTRSGATRAPRVQGAFNIYREMDVLHRSLGASLDQIADPVEKQIVNDIFHNLQGRVDDVSGTRQWVPGLLSEPRIWGEAANIHARYSQNVSEAVNLEKALLNRMRERTSSEGEQLAARFTTGKLRGALEYLGSQKGEDLRSGLLEWLDRQETLARIYRDDLGAGRDADTLLDSIARERADLARTVDHFEAYNTMRRGEQMEQRARGFGAAAGIGGTAVAGGLIGYSVTGDPAAALPIAVGFAALTRPMLYYRLLATKDRVLNRAFQGRFTAAMSRLKSRLKGLPVRSRKGFISPLVAPMVIADSRQERDREFDDRVAELRQLQTNPQAVVDNVGDSLADMDTFMPRTASYMHEAVQRGLQYLIAHLPLAEQNPLGPQFTKRRPSNTEQDNFLRIFRVVDDPLSAVEELADLRLHPIAARTLRDVYPEIFNLTRSELVFELGELEQDPPYQVKISLGTLLQYPTDASLDPAFISMLQSRSAQTTEQAQTVGLSRQGARSGLAERTLTETSSLMNTE